MIILPKPQRIRDPLYNLITFDNDEFEAALWRVIQTRQFQRLRRVRQLGFSEFVYPGATHSRFSHSIGVFHVARMLMGIIKRHMGSGNYRYMDSKAHAGPCGQHLFTILGTECSAMLSRKLARS